jgi:ribosomal protein S18 acetylase RimI-like enzyme
MVRIAPNLGGRSALAVWSPQQHYVHFRENRRSRTLGWHRELVRVQSTQEKEQGPREIAEHFTVISSDGNWNIRQIDRTNFDEIRRVVHLQAEGFHDPNPFPFIDEFLKTSFKAEVLSEMQKKLKYNPRDTFACLVVETTDGANDGVVGVVEVSYINEKEVLRSLEPSIPGVVYIASMAIAPSMRRRGAATALLEGAVEVTKAWNEKLCVLHVYQDNKAAINLYKRAGFEIIFGDASWLAKVGVRPRFLMKKDI